MKPILFNTEMVRAILDGRKTVTRRVVKPQHIIYADGSKEDFENIERDARFPFLGVTKNHPNIKTVLVPPCVPGDILYVRETWAKCQNAESYVYKADFDGYAAEVFLPRMKWHPSIHMPKEAARLFLRVTDVRVERLQEIGNCIKEGIPPGTHTTAHMNEIDERWAFAHLWDSTIKPADLLLYGWESNPFVWVIEFERCEKPKEEYE